MVAENVNPHQLFFLMRACCCWFSCSVVSNALQPHGLQHARLPCPSPSPELAQTHVHQVGDAIQPAHPLSSPSSPAFSLSQHQGLFSESVLHIRWAKHWSFSISISPSNEYLRLISFKMDWLISLQSKELSRVFSSTMVQKHQLLGAQLSL